MAILNKGQTFSDGEQVTSAKLNTAVDGATFASGAVDDVSTQLSGGAIIVKDGGVTTAKIADDAVTTTKIADNNVTTAKIADNNVITSKIADSNVTTVKIADNNITTSKIANSNITTEKIADSNVTKGKIENVANMKVLGNTSGSSAAPQEVSILDEDNMASNSNTAIPTQQSVKSYVDGGFNPTNYTGGESVTFPNGLIMKIGNATSSSDGQQTFNFSSAFPTSCTAITLGGLRADVTSLSASSFTVDRTDSLSGSFVFYWQAIGY